MGGISISTLIALSLMLLFLYVSTIGMIWAISMDEKIFQNLSKKILILRKKLGFSLV